MNRHPRGWKVGEVIDRDEALRRARELYKVPPYDNAAAEARLSCLIAGGWLALNADGTLTCTEPDPTPPTVTATVQRWTPEHTVVRRRKVIDAETGETFEVDLPFTVPESTVEVSRIQMPA